MATAIDKAGDLIPSDIFQMLIRDDGSLPSLPSEIERNIRLVTEAHPWARHHLLSGRDVRSFIDGNFGGEVVEAYDQLTPYAYRCDLARYCLLFVHGGLYVDLGVRFISALRGPGHIGIVAFRDFWHSTRHANGICNGVLLARAGRPELKTAIEIITAHVRERFYGALSLDPTGPPVFARAIAHHNDGASYHFGEYRAVAPETRFKNLVFLTPEGEIVALGKSGPGADMTYAGLDGVNNYGQLWQARRVYGEIAETWRFDSPRIYTRVGQRGPRGIAYETSIVGYILCGPYSDLGPGKYRAKFHFASQSTIDACSFEVAIENGTKLIAAVAKGEAKLIENCVALDFSLSQSTQGIECRIRAHGSDRGQFQALTIEPLDPISEEAGMTKPPRKSASSLGARRPRSTRRAQP